MDLEASARRFIGRLVEQLRHPTAVAIYVIILVVIITTRFGSGRAGSTIKTKDGAKAPFMPGYWLPSAGHALQLNWNPDGFLARTSKAYPSGIFSLYLHGKFHTFLSRPAFVSQLLGQPQTAANGKVFSRAVDVTVFGFSRDDLKLHENLGYEGLTTKRGVTNLVDSVLRQLKEHVGNLVTFNTWPIDQMDWERVANADLIETGDDKEAIMEVDFMELMRNFIARTTGAAIFGTDFVENLPEFWTCLWTMDAEYRTLAMNLPAWAPWGRFQRARSARRKMISLASEFQVEMDKHFSGEEPSLKWQDLDNVSLLEKARVEASRKEGRSIDGRARSDIALAFATTVNLAPLTTWMIYEISKDASLLAEIREEIAPFVQAVQPQSEFGPTVWVAPKIAKLDVNGLETKCPLFKAAYLETLRVYSVSWLIRWIAKDIVLTDESNPEEKYVLRKGTCAHVPQSLHQLDPVYYPNPEEWQARRHVTEEVDAKGKKNYVAKPSTIKPFGDGPSVCKGKDVATHEMLAYAAVILSLYEISSPKDKPWRKPKLRKKSGTRYPTKPLKVWIKKRELAREK